MFSLEGRIRNLSTKVLILLFVIAIALLLGGIYFYKKKITPIIYKYKIDQVMKKAAEIPDDYWDQRYKDVRIKNSYKVVFVASAGGEFNYAEFFKYAAEKKRWEVQIYFYTILGREKEILNFDPDFILFNDLADSRFDSRLLGHRSKKYLLSLSPIQILQNGIKKEYPYLTTIFDFNSQNLLSYYDGVFTTAKEIDLYRQMAGGKDVTFNAIRILPLVPALDNKGVAEPKSLIWYGQFWDEKRRGSDYKRFISKLSNNIPIKIYGRYHNYNFLALNVYGGYIPTAIDLIDAIRKNGIYLLTHSDSHILSGTPSLRLFEATAANAVVISDKHPFVIEHFGDNVLYFDQTADAETMYKQVKAHYDWIKANPEKAKAMAARAHQIFLEKFTLEKDLIRIAKMHEYIVRQEKELNLTYPMVH